jgi:hypothetical protein
MRITSYRVTFLACYLKNNSLGDPRSFESTASSLRALLSTLRLRLPLFLSRTGPRATSRDSPQFTTPRDKALARQLRLEKAQQWFLPQIVLFTPIIIQLSIILFLVAVLDLLFNIEVILAYVLLSIESSFLLLFVFTSIIALSIPFGPYRGPLVNVWFVIGSLLFPNYRPSDRERRRPSSRTSGRRPGTAC